MNNTRTRAIKTSKPETRCDAFKLSIKRRRLHGSFPTTIPVSIAGGGGGESERDVTCADNFTETTLQNQNFVRCAHTRSILLRFVRGYIIMYECVLLFIFFH